MKNLNFVSIVSLFLLTIHTSAQKDSTLNTSDLFNLSLSELLDIPINVSTTLPVNVFKTPSNVTIIDRKTIDNYNFLSVAEAVRITAGVEILQTIIDRDVPTIRGVLQNFYANKVLIMINNIPVWQPTYGNGTLARIDINDVERIEILRGPASVLYGTNAYNGVINIVLREQTAQGVIARINAGYPNYGATSVNINFSKGDFAITISGNTLNEMRTPYLVKGGADTLFINDIVNFEGNEIEHQTTLYENDTLFYFGEAYHKYTTNLELNYKAHTLYMNTYMNSYTHPGSSGTYKSGAGMPFVDKGTLLSYTFSKDLGTETHLKANIHYDYYYRDYIISLATPMSTRFSSYRLASSVKLNHKFNSKLKGETGIDFIDGHNIGHYIIDKKLNTVISENIMNEKHLLESSLFGQLNYNYKKINILTGSRYTYNQSFNSNISSRLMGIYTINDHNALKFMYGQSFRTPNLLELYFNHWSVVGNPALKPEKNLSHEVAYLTRGKYIFAHITSYYSHYSNLIQRVVTNPDQPATYINQAAFEAYGLETELKYQNPNLVNLMLNYNFMAGIKEESESNYQYVPSHYISAGVNKPFNMLSVASNMYWYSTTNGPWESVPSQLLVDAHITYKHRSGKGIHIRHSFSAKNLTNSNMLIPEYIRKKPGVNTLSTTGFGRRVIYTLNIVF